MNKGKITSWYKAELDKQYQIFSKMVDKLVMNKGNIHFAHFGNGLSVYNIDREDPNSNDYEKIAHISPTRVVSWYKGVDYIKEEQKEHIQHVARTANPHISFSQDTPVFNTKYLGDETEE